MLRPRFVSHLAANGGSAPTPNPAPVATLAILLSRSPLLHLRRGINSWIPRKTSRYVVCSTVTIVCAYGQRFNDAPGSLHFRRRTLINSLGQKKTSITTLACYPTVCNIHFFHVSFCFIALYCTSWELTAPVVISPTQLLIIEPDAKQWFGSFVFVAQHRLFYLAWSLTSYVLLCFYRAVVRRALGAFHLLNFLPVGQVRLLQCLTGCLRGVGDALDSAGCTSAEGAFKKVYLSI